MVIELNEIIGVVYPVPVQYIDRLFDEDRNVFVKYVRSPSIKVNPRDKVLIYASQGSKEVVGEGIIDALYFKTPEEVLKKYGDKLFLTRDELYDYARSQPTRPLTKKMLVLVLSGLRKYSDAIKYPRPMTMAGEYITREKYESLVES